MSEVEADVALSRASRRLRVRVLAILLGLAILATCVVLYVMRQHTPQQELRTASTLITQRRAEYCAIYNEMRAHESRTVIVPQLREPLVLPGFIYLQGDLSRPNANVNTDAIMSADLAILCGASAPYSGPHVFDSVLQRISLGENDHTVSTFDAHGIRAAARVLQAVRYLLVFQSDVAARSTMAGTNTFVGGAVAGTLLLYSVHDARCIMAFDVSLSAPRTQTVEVTQFGSAAQKRSDAERSLSAADSAFYEAAVVRLLAERGVRLVTHTGS